MNYCSQCGDDTEQFKEGVCVDCCDQNQRELDHHNAQYDAWQKLNDQERDVAIKSATDKTF